MMISHKAIMCLFPAPSVHVPVRSRLNSGITYYGGAIVCECHTTIRAFIKKCAHLLFVISTFWIIDCDNTEIEVGACMHVCVCACVCACTHAHEKISRWRTVLSASGKSNLSDCDAL